MGSHPSFYCDEANDHMRRLSELEACSGGGSIAERIASARERMRLRKLIKAAVDAYNVAVSDQRREDAKARFGFE